MRKLLVLCLLVLVPAEQSFAAADPVIAQQLQGVLDGIVKSSQVPVSVMASVSAPTLNLDWSGAAGPFERGHSAPVQPNTPFRIASVTKVFVAAAIFRLIEEGRLGLYDPIVSYISTDTRTVLESGGYAPKRIRVQHLLSHTSGLYDYAMDEGYQNAVAEGGAKGKRWTPLEQITWAVKHGHPLGKPGERYGYADTNYVILGEIISRVSGQSMAAYIRQSLNLDGEQLKATWFETLEPAPAGVPARVHQYWYDVDLTDVDPSFDLYGGGGIVSTTSDLNRFLRALLTGKLFKHPATLTAGLVPAEPVPHKEEHVRAIMIATEPFGVRKCLGHLGFWGTTALYCPDLDLAVTTNITQSLDDEKHGASATRRKLMNGIAAVVVGPLERARRSE